MRVPDTIPRQTLRAYDCSRATRRLGGESRRRVRAEAADRDAGTAPTLKDLAVQALVRNFSGRTPLQSLPREDLHRLLETLPASVPLEVSVPLVPDGVYWQRLAADTYPTANNVVAEHGGSWRRLVLERRLQQELQDALPPMLEGALRLARLAGPFVRRLRLDRLLQTALAPSGVGGHAADYPAPLALGGGWTPDLPQERREMHMFDAELDTLREDLGNVLAFLVNLEELDVMFGMHDFEKNLAEPPNLVKVACCQALGQTLGALPAFRRLRVRRSQLHLEKLAGLLEPLQASATLAALDLSHCYLGDKGVQVVAAFLQGHASLQVLRLADNKFGARGATHLAKALLQKTCAPLVELDVSLNAIGDVGGHNVLMAAVPRDHRLPLRDPADDEYVRELMQAEEKERQRRAAAAAVDEEPTHEGITVFRGLVQRAIAGELPAEVEAAPPSAADDADLDWDAEPDPQGRRASALLAVVAEARLHQREEEAAAEAREEEDQRRREAAARAAERWDGLPERLRTLSVAACRLGAAGGRAAALVLRCNRVLTSVSLANNRLGEEACAGVVRALESNPHVLLLDLRMCGASWTDQAALDRAVGANNEALRQPLPLRDMLAEREAEYRLRLATTTEVLGRQWERCQGLPRGQRSSIAVPAPAPTDASAATASTGGFSGLSQSLSLSGGGGGGASAANSGLSHGLAPRGPAPAPGPGLGRHGSKGQMRSEGSRSQQGSGVDSLRSGPRRTESSTLSQPSHQSGASKANSHLSVR